MGSTAIEEIDATVSALSSRSLDQRFWELEHPQVLRRLDAVNREILTLEHQAGLVPAAPHLHDRDVVRQHHSAPQAALAMLDPIVTRRARAERPHVDKQRTVIVADQPTGPKRYMLGDVLDRVLAEGATRVGTQGDDVAVTA